MGNANDKKGTSTNTPNTSAIWRDAQINWSLLPKQFSGTTLKTIFLFCKCLNQYFWFYWSFSLFILCARRVSSLQLRFSKEAQKTSTDTHRLSSLHLKCWIAVWGILLLPTRNMSVSSLLTKVTTLNAINRKLVTSSTGDVELQAHKNQPMIFHTFYFLWTARYSSDPVIPYLTNAVDCNYTYWRLIYLFTILSSLWWARIHAPCCNFFVPDKNGAQKWSKDCSWHSDYIWGACCYTLIKGQMEACNRSTIETCFK